MTQTTKGDFHLQVNPMGTSVTGGPFTLDIAAAGGGALTLTPASGDLPEGQEGVAYDSGVSEISGGVPPYTLSNETDVPSGLALAILSDGITVQLSGTPVVGDAAESPFNIGFTVTDSSGASVAALNRVGSRAQRPAVRGPRTGLQSLRNQAAPPRKPRVAPLASH